MFTPLRDPYEYEYNFIAISYGMTISSIQGIELITRLTQNGVATEFKSTRRCVSMGLVTVRPPYIVSILGEL